MPLHLLGKKSWNVYNTENIARVKRDEAEARAKEEDDERRMQEADAEHRLSLLRGSGVPRADAHLPQSSEAHHSFERNQKRRGRRLEGEDDTDRDIRLAKEDAADVLQVSQSTLRSSTSEPLIDHRGHINLFPQVNKRKNEEAEAEAAKKKRELEDQYTMRFSNAAGNKPGSDKPWYTASTGGDLASRDIVSRDVWGNEDPERRHREQQRSTSGDPLAVMKKGIKNLREAEKHRKEWIAQRERDLYEVEELAKRHQRDRKRKSSEDSLEEFRLDETDERPRNERPRSSKESEKRHHRHRHRHRSDGDRERCRSRKNDRCRSRSPEDGLK